MILLLLLLIIIPIASYRWARIHRPDYNIAIPGVTFGTSVAPFSMGLYATFFVHWLGLVTGMLGLVMVMFHGSPGFHVATHLELIPPGVVTALSSSISIAIINGVIWGVIYGLFGIILTNTAIAGKTLTVRQLDRRQQRAAKLTQPLAKY